MRRPTCLAIAAAAALTLAPGAPAAGAEQPKRPPRPIELRSGWEIRDVATPATPAQAAPPAETQGARARAAARLPARPAQAAGEWRPAKVPGVFHPLARAEHFGGSVKLYRLRFEAPDVEGYAWALRFEQVRRRATVSLNGRRIGIGIDPYTPFQIPARGLRPGKVNTLEVLVDSRKDPRLPEGWWNWGGITRPVSLVPVGAAHVDDLGLMPDVHCDGPATDCEAALLIDGVLGKLPREASAPRLTIRLRSPSGRVTRRGYAVQGSHFGRRRVRIQLAVPAPRLWSPERPQLYDARLALSHDGRVVQVERRRIGLRSVDVRDGALLLNNRPIQLRGASIHEDFPGRGAAPNGYDMDTVVRELQELGANVTRAHYVLSEGLLRRLDAAGIMVYNQAPIWQRDRNRRLRRSIDRKRAVAQVRRTVIAARSHPSVIVHSVANELAFAPDGRPDTPRFVTAAIEAARDLDPLLPVAIDLKTRTWLERQETYAQADVIGINQYFGWYPWNPDFADLEPFLERMRAAYPNQALVMTELGAEGRPDMADARADVKGGYAFQASHVARTIDLVDRLPFMSGAIHWTLREFEIFPGWRGGAIEGDGPNDDIRHHKGVLTYRGTRKPAWHVLRERYARTPLYR
ncbi:MAG: glycoside hydrolase family 2 TIM barrel-domain containing protein [Thermoleophilaceae bacterium]